MKVVCDMRNVWFLQGLLVRMAFLRLPIALVASLVLAGCEGGGTDGGSSDTGRGGSTARMVVIDDYLYAISDETQGFSRGSVQLFDVSAPEEPNPWVRVSVDRDIETLFPYGDYLLVGAADGMHIMDNTDKANPQYVVKFEHAQARDPVVAMGGYAYVTLANDFGGVNEMLVVDINDITNPQLVRQFAMQQPAGLAVTEDELFVCDGPAGLKIFDRTNPVELSIKETIRGIECRDVIVEGDNLIAITDEGLFQYEHAEFPALPLSSL